MLSKNLYSNNPAIISLQTRYNELKDQLQKLESANSDILLSFSDAPELAAKLSELMRDVKIYNEVYLMLQQQYFKEKIQENKDLPTVEILDAGIPPLKADSPRIIFSAVLGGISIFLFFVLLTVIEIKDVFKYLKYKGLDAK